MSEDLLGGVEESLWERARTAPYRLLALDCDGTLAPCALDPASAHRHSGARRELERIVRGGRTAVAILSGRPPVEIVRRLGDLAVPIVGEHGRTTRFPDGAVRHRPFDAELQRRLDRAQVDLELAVAPARIERQPSALLVHTLGLPRVLALSAERRARTVIAQRHSCEGLEVRPFDGGLELCAKGHYQRSALVELLEPMGTGAFPVVLGDDSTGEEAFRTAIERGGTGVRVGGERSSAAPSRLASAEEVAAFLTAWSEQVDGRETLPDSP